MKRFFAVLISVVSVFTCSLFFSCGEKDFTFNTLTFYCPDGAPALSIAKFINDGENFGFGGQISYKVVSSNDIGGVIQKGEGDFVIAPVNACTKLYNANESNPYKMLAVVTHGNLYIVSKTEISLSDLTGKVVGVIGQGLVTDLTLQAVLKKNSVDYVAGDAATEGKASLRYFAGASDLIPMLKTGKVEIGLLPEPALTKLQTSVAVEYKYKLDLQELYDSESKAYPQAVLMVKSSVLTAYPELKNAIAEKFSGGLEWLKNNTEDGVSAINYVLKEGVTPSLSAADINATVIDNCKIFWQDSLAAKNSVIDYINAIRSINPNSAKTVEDGFFA